MVIEKIKNGYIVNPHNNIHYMEFFNTLDEVIEYLKVKYRTTVHTVPYVSTVSEAEASADMERIYKDKDIT